MKEAYSDLKKYFDGTSSKGNNNPWRNAYNHASHCDIKAKDSLKKQIKILANFYDDESYGNIEDYNIIPCSTIFLNNNWNEDFINDFMASIHDLNNFTANRIDLIVLTKLSLQSFIEFLKLEENND